MAESALLELPVPLHVCKTTEPAARGACDCCWEGECSQVYGQMQPFSSFLPRSDLQTATGQGQSDGCRQGSLSQAQEGLPYTLNSFPLQTLSTRHVFPESQQEVENGESFGVPSQGIKWIASLSMEMCDVEQYIATQH